MNFAYILALILLAQLTAGKYFGHLRHQTHENSESEESQHSKICHKPAGFFPKTYEC